MIKTFFEMIKIYVKLKQDKFLEQNICIGTNVRCRNWNNWKKLILGKKYVGQNVVIPIWVKLNLTIYKKI